MTNKIILDSTCPNNNCVFTYGALATSPSLTAISSATVVSGTGSITLTGTNLNSANLADVNVVL